MALHFFASFLIDHGIRVLSLLLFVAGLAFLLHLSTNCVDPRPNVFEQFEGGPTLSDYTSRTQKLEVVKEALSDDISELDDLVDETCGIVGHVKETYIGNNSMPLDDSENSLPKDVQKSRMDRRKVRAAKRFDDEKAVFGSVAKKTLLECFEDGSAAAAAKQDADAELTDAQRDLAAVVDEVTRILDTAQVKAALLKSQQIAPTLQFTGKYVKQASDSLASSSQTVTMESFEGGGGSSSSSSSSRSRGAELIRSADELLTRAETIRKTVQDLKASVQQQKDAIQAMRDAQARGIVPASSPS